MSDLQKVGRDVRLAVDVVSYNVVEGGSASSGDAGTVTRGLGALKARISLSQSGQHVDYTLQAVFEGRETWTLRKRFNEVAALHDVLQQRLHALPELPAKSMVRHFSPEYLEARKAGLAAYLKALCRRRDVVNCREVQEFFGLNTHVAAFAQPCAWEPRLVADVHEPTFGVTGVAYDPDQGFLLLGATDSSWTSRMDTRITNIKLPWEPAAPEMPSSQMSLWRQAPGSFRFELQSVARYAASISCVALSNAGGRGLCLCGLSDGTVGYKAASFRAPASQQDGSKPHMRHETQGEQPLQMPPVASTGSRGGTLPLLRHTAAVAALAVDHAESWVITASKDNALMVYDSQRYMIQCEVQTPAPTTAMHYCQARKRLFTGLQSGRIITWDTTVLPLRQLCVVPEGPVAADLSSQPRVSALDFDPAASTLFAGSREGFALWEMRSSNTGSYGRALGKLSPLSSQPTTLAWAPSSRELLAAFSGGAVVIFDVERAEASYAFQAHTKELTAFQWVEDGQQRLLLTASKDQTVKFWSFPCQKKGLEEDQPPAVPWTEPEVSVSRLQRSRANNSQEPARNAQVGQPAGPEHPTSTRPSNVAAASGVAATAGYPAPPAEAPVKIAGAAPGAAARPADDSDEELRGWDD